MFERTLLFLVNFVTIYICQIVSQFNQSVVVSFEFEYREFHVKRSLGSKLLKLVSVAVEQFNHYPGLSTSNLTLGEIFHLERIRWILIE